MVLRRNRHRRRCCCATATATATAAAAMRTENARLQEDAAGSHLPYFEHNAAQLPAVDGLFTHLLLRVRRSSMGHRSTGSPLHRVWRQVPRKVQGPPQRRLPPKYGNAPQLLPTYLPTVSCRAVPCRIVIDSLTH